MKVAIIIPTMNRPDFVLRQFRFYELTESPHPLYISDSSNEENAKRIKDSIKQFKKLNITYQWVPPGKDCLYKLLPLVNEKYCIQTGDDDLIISSTISDCADFLEAHPNYGICSGKQVNIRFRKEDYNKPYGVIERHTQPLGRSLEDDDMLVRTKNFWTKTFFICFAVRRTETERSLRYLTKNFSLVGHMMDFSIVSAMLISGKCKVFDKLAYIMQISNIRYGTEYGMGINLITSPFFSEQWKIYEDGFSEIIRQKGISQEESVKIVRSMFVMDLAHHFQLEAADLPIGPKNPVISKHNLLKELRYLMSGHRFLKSIYYKFNSPNYVNRPESKYYNDFKVVKDFLEKNNASDYI